MVVISVPWLGVQLLGEILSSQFLLHVRVTGVYTAEDFQAVFNQCDALGVLELLEALDICIEVRQELRNGKFVVRYLPFKFQILKKNYVVFQCDIEGEIEYEFPLYNQTETLEGLWDQTDSRYSSDNSVHGGIRLYSAPGTYHLFKPIFYNVQVGTVLKMISTDSIIALKCRVYYYTIHNFLY